MFDLIFNPTISSGLLWLISLASVTINNWRWRIIHRVPCLLGTGCLLILKKSVTFGCKSSTKSSLTFACGSLMPATSLLESFKLRKENTQEKN